MLAFCPKSNYTSITAKKSTTLRGGYMATTALEQHLKQLEAQNVEEQRQKLARGTALAARAAGAQASRGRGGAPQVAPQVAPQASTPLTARRATAGALRTIDNPATFSLGEFFTGSGDTTLTSGQGAGLYGTRESGAASRATALQGAIGNPIVDTRGITPGATPASVSSQQAQVAANPVGASPLSVVGAEPATQPQATQSAQTPDLQIPTFSARTRFPGVTEINSNVPGFTPIFTNRVEGGISPEQALGFATQTLLPGQENFVTDASGNKIFPNRQGINSPEFQRLYSRQGVGSTAAGQTVTGQAATGPLVEAPGLGGGIFQTKFNPATGQMERTQIGDTALDFGRNQRELLNTSFARKIEAGMDPTAAAEDARLEVLATSSPGGRVEASILSGIQQRRAERERAAAESRATIGKAEAEMDKLGTQTALLQGALSGSDPELARAARFAAIGAGSPPALQQKSTITLDNVLGKITPVLDIRGNSTGVQFENLPGEVLTSEEAQALTTAVQRGEIPPDALNSDRPAAQEYLAYIRGILAARPLAQ